MNLTDVEARILGALIEKESTTPDNYPLSLNALTAACNQLSSREPVMSLAEDTVKWAVNNLRQQSLVRAIQPADARVMKFHHLLAEKLDLSTGERAVIAVLLLRGAQTLSEIKTRTTRLAEFPSLADVESTVNGLIAREFVVELLRRSGQKEVRFGHLLSGPPSEAPANEERAEAEHAAPVRDGGDDRVAALERTVDELQREVAELRSRFDEFKAQFG